MDLSITDLDKAHLLASATEEYERRRRRDSVFGPSLFSDPAWDILLFLFICDLNRRAASKKETWLSSCSPPTTALRWIAALEAAGLVTANPDEFDKRRSLVRITAKARHQIVRYFAQRGPIATSTPAQINGRY